MKYQYDRTEVFGANEIQDIIDRNAKWLAAFIISGVRALLKDGRPPFTERVSEQERLQNLLNASPAFWDALQAQDPETAAAMVAMVVKAREKGKIPAEGPLANMVGPEDTEMPPEADLGLPGEVTGQPQSQPQQVTTPAAATSGPGAVDYTG